MTHPLPALFLASLLLSSLLSSGPAPSGEASERRQGYLEVLRIIFSEVKDLGNYPGEDFIKREFFLGLDDDDTNKDQHVVVLIQTLCGQEVMSIQVTFMEKRKDNPNIRYAKSVRSLSCFCHPDKLAIRSSDYAESDLKGLALDILRAVRDKKKLLKEYGPIIRNRP